MKRYSIYNLEFDLDRLEKEAFEIPELCHEREYISNSDFGVQIHEHSWEKFINLSDSYIENIFIEELKKFLNVTESTKNKQFRFSNIWLNINYPGSYNKAHTHNGCERSGVFYVKVPEDSGDLYFTKMDEYIKPYPGLLVLFDSNEEHAVEPNISDEPRISFAFNYRLKDI